MESKEKILVVDDDPEIGFMLKMMLEHKGFDVTVLQRAEATADTVKENEIDLVILDMLIAGIMGTDVCRALKANPATALLPVLMITALPDAEKVCMPAGADAVLSKPFEMSELVTNVHTLLSLKHDTG
ncbi:MAG: response regulator [Gloeobacteraceae cyanobacterium ES-bin-316]|nr:response regulator [Ferruginibacter sp.]